MATLREQLAAVQAELIGEKIAHERLVRYMDKVLKEYAKLEKEVELLRERELIRQEFRQ